MLNEQKNSVVVCEKINIEIFNINHGVTTTGWVHPDRILDYNVLLFIKSGVFRVTEDDTDYEVKPNETLFLKSGHHHYGKRPVDDGTSWYWIHFYDNICSFCDLDKPCPLILHSKPHVAQNNMLILPKICRLSNPSAVMDRMKRALTLSTSHMQGDRVQVNSLVFETIAELLYQSRQETNRRVDVLTSQIIAFINDNPFASARQLSESIHFNYEYLSRVFSKNMKMTIRHYKNQIKIQRAIELLKTSNKTIAEISGELGYENPYYFSRVFKQIAGVSPLKFKQSIYTFIPTSPPQALDED